MNPASDTLSSKSEDQVESAREETRAEPSVTLVDLGKVSDTKGGWIGSKQDSGAGLQVY
jgi:hypothetical protein